MIYEAKTLFLCFCLKLGEWCKYVGIVIMQMMLGKNLDGFQQLLE